MSHELRTPLNGVVGFADLLLNDHFGELNPQQKVLRRISWVMAVFGVFLYCFGDERINRSLPVVVGFG
jgi:signal transduction histidine kinase